MDDATRMFDMVSLNETEFAVLVIQVTVLINKDIL